ncbi:hypothetical protein SP90_07940 [Halodesulfovibrio spirochaetisodalis]|uniref:Uncharacterized protein n=2 Tax=Halodesulfovibrio spirochaetisodalis TaxID=1560234 RepID=A0A1B7XDI1_9BACT|nr:hypothetical protein SP90_07940 [Halodesulfovibrio spirochaetisodalis]
MSHLSFSPAASNHDECNNKRTNLKTYVVLTQHPTALVKEVPMKNRGSVISYVAIIIIALALIVRLIFPDINWWALILIIPIALLIWKSFSAWASQRRTALLLIQATLILITIFIAFFYKPLWGVIYIPILLIIGLTGLLAAISNK